MIPHCRLRIANVQQRASLGRESIYQKERFIPFEILGARMCISGPCWTLTVVREITHDLKKNLQIK